MKQRVPDELVILNINSTDAFTLWVVNNSTDIAPNQNTAHVT